MRLLRSRTWRTALLVWGVLLVVGVGTLVRNRMAVEAWVVNRYAIYTYSTGPAGLWKDLAGGRFTTKSTVDELVAAYPPDHRREAGRFTLLGYDRADDGGRATFIARDGRLATAMLNTGNESGWTTVFDTLSDAERTTFLNDLRTAATAEWRQTPALAVAGFGATFDPRDFRRLTPAGK